MPIATTNNAPQAFLSYTRIDDEAFGGAITSLRRLLELRVQSVAGSREFTIFQDVEGIELGQKWQKRLDEAVSSSMFLIPIVTPLFFTSEPCRDELSKFIAHEKTLGRDDLILPIYFVTAPNLEKEEERKDDSLAKEIASRQLYDWRDAVDLPLDDPQIRKAIRKLAEGVASALGRSISPVPVEDGREELSELAKTLELQRAAPTRHRRVLWVDDRPTNNVLERKSMAAYNIDFSLAKSTGQALAELTNGSFDAIISDMGRPPDGRAGYTLLEALRESGDRTPYFIYAGSNAAKHKEEALDRGAQGSTNRSDELIHMVLQALERRP
ncbi:TIR domain-containing protein [Mycolicibacterium neworleansense]|uniref:Response regulator receiver domain protein n=1 Tax=Mycolicibacterium neworleansense TaxID=146018 RepID=A0A0H5S4U3_9MYCO|nr:TIR domain-containing protein [Mycolicibacterium neworleansense]MCV7365370.1 TIR domain-containing protein [Mycolicibacterium neworleansense]CRZ16174.1 Response regulator receiver domain protein [Mycolicibacterium neworleansense]